jgi:hypothetical protein
MTPEQLLVELCHCAAITAALFGIVILHALVKDLMSLRREREAELRERAEALRRFEASLSVGKETSHDQR